MKRAVASVLGARIRVRVTTLCRMGQMAVDLTPRIMHGPFFGD
jgi:hypothetical protein